MHPATWWSASSLTRWWGQGADWLQGSRLAPYWEHLLAGWIALVLIGLPFLSNEQLGVLLLGGVMLWLGSLWWSPPQGVSITALLYGVALTLATAFSPVKRAAFAGWVKACLYLATFGALLRGVRRWGKILLVGHLLVTLAVVLIGLRQWFFGAEALATWIDPESPLAGTTRVYSVFGNPNLLAAYLVPGVGMGLGCLLAWRTWAQRLLALTLVVTFSSCLILTGSRGGWLGLATVYASFSLMASWAWWQWHKWHPLWRRLLFGLGAGLLLVSVLALLGRSETLRLRFLSMFAGRADSSNNFRLNVWAAVLAMIRDHPWLGIGPGNRAFNLIYPLYQRPNFNALGAYSVPLEVAVEAGLVGLTAFAALTATILRRSWQHLRNWCLSPQPPTFLVMGLLAGLAGTMAHGLVDTLWFRPQIQVLWWFNVALVWSTYDSSSS
ncbi:MAG: IctB family putative bicarbonate transporter [Gloeomargarita sp. SKYBB_i_bin120]|nr:IctB family putative bicarbonate transporter [Gloeomargarita sp. SKYG98]MCS7291500.1 IctB family putative bicarbonate transporter [Gloeomargarita sp. SKYB120]MDW8177060.1 IctB family putative bicarbonate transporter [Gloeomargarita sp. SKYBB_i_bin120]